MTEQIRLEGYKAATRNRVLTSELASKISPLLPARFQSHLEWDLKYNLEQDGASLRTLYERVKPANTKQHAGYVLAIRDADGGIFGAYTNDYFHPREGGRYYGNGDCFLWTSGKTAGSPGFKAFPFTGANDFIISCTVQFLSLGGGDGHYGLWVDSDLNNGLTYKSQTFDNEPLSAEGHKFQVIGVEVWRV